MTRDWCVATPQGVRLVLHIVPNASRSEIVGVLDDALKIRLQALPVDGKANEALVRFVAQMLDVPKSAVQLVHGHSSRRKSIEITGAALSVATIKATLWP